MLGLIIRFFWHAVPRAKCIKQNLDRIFLRIGNIKILSPLLLALVEYALIFRIKIKIPCANGVLVYRKIVDNLSAFAFDNIYRFQNALTVESAHFLIVAAGLSVEGYII